MLCHGGEDEPTLRRCVSCRQLVREIFLFFPSYYGCCTVKLSIDLYSVAIRFGSAKIMTSDFWRAPSEFTRFVVPLSFDCPYVRTSLFGDVGLPKLGITSPWCSLVDNFVTTTTHYTMRYGVEA